LSLNQAVILQLAEGNLSSKLSKVALEKTYGLKNCDKQLVFLMNRYLIIDMFNCTSAADLTQVEKDCLLGLLQGDLDVNCS
jgi:hypothetical protein